MLAECLHVAAALCVTVLTVNYGPGLKGLVTSVVPWLDPTLASFVTFWAFFLALLMAGRYLLRSLERFLTWERLHWITRGLGLMLGAARGVWWAGLILLAFAGSGVEYLEKSQSESILGPGVVQAARQAVERASDVFPGADRRYRALVPPLKAGQRPSA